jgi:hypothetical protein
MCIHPTGIYLWISQWELALSTHCWCRESINHWTPYLLPSLGMASALRSIPQVRRSINYDMVVNHASCHQNSLLKAAQNPSPTRGNQWNSPSLPLTISSVSRTGTAHCNRSRWYESDQETRRLLPSNVSPRLSFGSSMCFGCSAREKLINNGPCNIINSPAVLVLLQVVSAILSEWLSSLAWSLDIYLDS